MNNVDELIKALTCTGFIGGPCFRDCKHRENGFCELTHSSLNKQAADALKQLRAENISLRAERDALLKSIMKVAEEIETIQPRGLLE